MGRPDYVQLLRLAALLHDIGHLPFSHVGETAWHAASSPTAFAYVDQDGSTVFDAAAGASGKSLHESLSELIVSASQIASIIDIHVDSVDGQPPPSQIVASILSGRQTDLVAHNLLSSDLDCDRLDYLLRDSVSAGLVYGNIDLDYLIGNLVVAADPGGAVLAINGKHGRMAGEHFLLARYFHYAQFISHKTVAAAEVDLIAAILELIRLEKLPSYGDLFVADAQQRLASLRTLTDHHVLATLEACMTMDGAPHLAEASRRLLRRKLLKTAARHEALEAVPQSSDPRAHKWDTLLRDPDAKCIAAQRCGVDAELFCYRRKSLPLTSIPGDIPTSHGVTEAGRRRTSQGVRKGAKITDDLGRPELLLERSSLLRHLSSQQWATRRVFVREPLDSYAPRCPTKTFTRIASYFTQELNT